jgi:hypothetical protein
VKCAASDIFREIAGNFSPTRPHQFQLGSKAALGGRPLLAHSGHSSLNAGCSQVDTWFSRARGGAFPSSLPKVQIDGTTGETWNLCFMRLARR